MRAPNLGARVATLAFALAVPRSAPAHELRCEAAAGIAAEAPGGGVAVGADGLPALVAPPLVSAVVDRYPAHVAVRLRVTNVLDEVSTVRGVDAPGWPGAARSFGAPVGPGTSLAPHATAEQVVVVRVGSREACLALAGSGGAPACAADGPDLRFTISHDAGATTCAARLHCAPDAAALPYWLGARRFGTFADDVAGGVAVDGLGNVHVAGATWSTAYQTQPGTQLGLLVSVDRGGGVSSSTWGSAGDFVYAKRVAADGAGNVVVVGSRGGTGTVRKLAPDGTVAWERTLGFTVTAVAVGPGGTVYAAGMVFGSDLPWTARVVKYDAAGDAVWEWSFVTPDEYQFPNGIGIDRAGSVFVAGFRSPVGDWARTGFVAKIDRGGALAWIRDVAFGSWEEVRDLAVAADGDVAVVGTANDPSRGGQQVAFVRSFDRDGVLGFTWSYAGVGFASGDGLAADPAGGFWVTGPAERGPGLLDVYVARLGPDGAERWVRTWGSSGIEIASGVALDRAGNAYVCGYTYGDFAGPNAGAGDVFVFRLDPEGNP
ncbi:MAG TPA: SBBP repeat-containing protein [Anaeromyxobacter sp.]|nr:SBBP repeat-containing protein [Anaeromyxobacter sp.]